MAARPHSRFEVRRHQEVRSHFLSDAGRDLRRFLCRSARFTIADLLHARRNIRAIALELGRSSSTVSREIRRNIHEPSGNYRPRTAQRNAERRRSRQLAREDRRQPGAEGSYVNTWHNAGVLGRSAIGYVLIFPDNLKCTSCLRPFIRPLYGRGSLDLAVDPAVSLRSGRTARRPRRRKEHRTRRFPDMVMIWDRPAEVIGRLVPGHREGI